LARDTWREQGLSELLRRMEKLPALIADVEKRREVARTIHDDSVVRHADAWDAATARVASSPRYGGLRLTAQVGLVPLGKDRASGLEEFVHLETGTIPARDASTGRIGLTDETGLVLVLVPGGRATIGSQAGDAGAPHHDDVATFGPVHEVELSPFFVSKYEMTQSQWPRSRRCCTPSRTSRGTARMRSSDSSAARSRRRCNGSTRAAREPRAPGSPATIPKTCAGL
jgi:formylglycine-generating enzyme required for sulfatase activity